jgi:two-component system, LytTR family, sensor kinase
MDNRDQAFYFLLLKTDHLSFMATSKNVEKSIKPFYPLKEVVGFILANIVFALIIMFAFFGSKYNTVNHFLMAFAWSFAICSTQWLGHAYIFDFLDKKISWLKYPVKRAVWGLASLVIYSAIAFYIIQFLFYYLYYGRMPEITVAWLVGNVVSPVAISFVVTITFTAIGFFNAWKSSFIEAQKLNTQVMTYKYEVLRNQINPHFLFNSFNVLSELVYEDQDLAIRFIQQLSKLFRYVLDSRDKEMVKVSEEMEFVRSFLYLMKIRLENKLESDIDIESLADEMIIPVSIQMLIENAVKHNEASEAFPLKIKIRRKDGFLIVSNTIKPKPAEDETTKLGLSNLRQQFAYFTEKPIRVEKTDTEFRVSLPIIKNIQTG